MLATASRACSCVGALLPHNNNSAAATASSSRAAFREAAGCRLCCLAHLASNASAGKGLRGEPPGWRRRRSNAATCVGSDVADRLAASAASACDEHVGEGLVKDNPCLGNRWYAQLAR